MFAVSDQTTVELVEDQVTKFAKQTDARLEEEDAASTDTGDELEVESEESDEEAFELHNNLQSMGLLMSRPRILAPIHEFIEDDAECTNTRALSDAQKVPLKISASTNLSRGRKEKVRGTDEIIKKRPLHAGDDSLLHNELQPVRITMNSFLLEDSFGDCLRNIIS